MYSVRGLTSCNLPLILDFFPCLISSHLIMLASVKVKCFGVNCFQTAIHIYVQFIHVCPRNYSVKLTRKEKGALRLQRWQSWTRSCLKSTPDLATPLRLPQVRPLTTDYPLTIVYICNSTEFQNIKTWLCFHGCLTCCLWFLKYSMLMLVGCHMKKKQHTLKTDI